MEVVVLYMQRTDLAIVATPIYGVEPLVGQSYWGHALSRGSGADCTSTEPKELDS